MSQGPDQTPSLTPTSLFSLSSRGYPFPQIGQLCFLRQGAAQTETGSS